MTSPSEALTHATALRQASLRPRPYRDPDVQALLHRLHTEQRALYGFADDVDDTPDTDYLPPAGLFLVAYLDEQPVACGGWRRITTGEAEIKRMFVQPELRGHELGRRLLRRLEQEARTAGARRIRLETGRDNHRALRLYLAAGYDFIPSYVPGRNPGINRALHKRLPP
jgi:GNAT superfamily N-acetyltransferase